MMYEHSLGCKAAKTGWEDHVNKDLWILHPAENKLSLEWATNEATFRFYFKRNWLVYSKRKPASKLSGMHHGPAAHRSLRELIWLRAQEILWPFLALHCKWSSYWVFREESGSRIETWASFKVWGMRVIEDSLFLLSRAFLSTSVSLHDVLTCLQHDYRNSWKNWGHHFSPAACYHPFASRAKKDLWEHRC